MSEVKTLTSIEITQVDNELYILALSWAVSSEIIHIKAGNGENNTATINLSSILNSGQWTMQILGLNWGGPAAFSITYTYADGTTREIQGPNPATSDVGLVFQDLETVQIA